MNETKKEKGQPRIGSYLISEQNLYGTGLGFKEIFAEFCHDFRWVFLAAEDIEVCRVCFIGKVS